MEHMWQAGGMDMRYFLVILGIFGAEWKVKNYIEEMMEEGRTKKCGGFLLIRKHHNRGAFLNVGQDRREVVMGLSVCLALALTVLFLVTLGNAGKGLLKWGLTLLLGGAYSNTYDRLARKYVVDYVSFNVPFGLRKVIFNIGDFCIMVGALLSVIGWEK